MKLFVVVNIHNSDGDTARVVLGVDNTTSLPDMVQNMWLLVIPNRPEEDGDVIELLPPDILISHAVNEPQLCLTDSVSRGKPDVMVLEPIAGDKYKVLHSNEKNCSAEWSTWSQCIDGVRSKSRDCYIREFNCSFFPEIVTEPCQQLGLLYPPDNTLFLIPGEFSTVKLRPIEVGLPVSFEYSSPDASSPVLSSNGTFQWTFPIGVDEDQDYSFTFALNNTEGHYRLIDLIVKSPHCGCTGMHDHCVLSPWGTVGFGQFECECQEGWTGELCDKDINECSDDPSPCFPGVLCINVIGSFWCDGCPEGMLGDGITCS
ncbi:Cubilin [Holothuria leucospilota]|uniref:Cubilin n=1 Tax=Holothuria leucospilota TaxID=206669 RepID=A0A9Q1BPQ4_HOLLE|nr:Cubilin [Holothuria leucospilota]